MHTPSTPTPARRAAGVPVAALVALAALLLAVAAVALPASLTPASAALFGSGASVADDARLGSGTVAAAVTAPELGAPAQPPPAPDPLLAAAASSCGVFDVAGCINEAFVGLLQAAVTDVINPALELLSESLLQTPQPSSVPRLAQLWSLSWQIAVALYATVVLLGGLIVMAQQSLQARYGVREIAPRLVVGFVAGWLSLPLVDMAVQIANALSAALVGGVDERAGVAGLAGLVKATIAVPSVGGLAWPLLLASAAVGVLLLAVLCGYVLRVVGLIVLVAAAPLVVMWHALPQTDALARWWWRAVAGLLVIQVVQALIISVGLVILLPPPGSDAAPGAGVLGLPAGGSGWVSLLVLAVLLWLLLRVPGWVWASVKVNAGGSSVLGTVVKTAIAIKTGGLIRGALAAGAATRRPRATPPPLGRGPGSAGPTDPYTNPPVGDGGQLAIPFTGLRSRHRRATAGPAPARGAETAPRPGRGQLALPLGEALWPEHRPVAGRDGQWQLPIAVERVPRPSGAKAPERPQTPGRSRGQQRFPPDGLWPEQRAVAARDGQLRLGIRVTRVPRPPAPAGPGRARPTVAGLGGRQMSLDLRPPDPYRGNRPLRSGQYPLPLPALHRHPAPAPAPAPGPGAAPPSRSRGVEQLRLPMPASTHPASRPAPPDLGRVPPPPPAEPRPASPPPAAPTSPPSPPPASADPVRRPRRGPQLPMRRKP